MSQYERHLVLDIWNFIFSDLCISRSLLPVPFFNRKDYFVGWDIGENTHRRLFPSCLSMFIKCMIIIIYLERLKRKNFSNKSTFVKILLPIHEQTDAKIQIKSEYLISSQKQEFTYSSTASEGPL